MLSSTSIEEYESVFAAWFGTKYAFSFWKGRVALYAILKAMGVGPGDEVVLPGYTCVMNVNPIMYLGGKPVYVDIEAETFNIDPKLLSEKITDNTKVIIAQHTYGYPCQLDAILSIAGKRGVSVVEDCCLAFGSRYRGKLVGTFGRAAYFSSQWNKPYTTGIGGMAITNDPELAQKIRSLRADEACSPSFREVLMLRVQLLVYRLFIYPRTTALAQHMFRYLTKKGVVVGSSEPSEFSPVQAQDFLKNMSSVQARSGLRQLERIEEGICHRKKLAELYDRLLEKRRWHSRNCDRVLTDPVMVRYPVRIAEKDEALAKAAKAAIELGSWFECPLHPIETPLAVYDYEVGMCPEAERACNQVVNLPLHRRVSERTVKRSVDFISLFTEIS
jgi:dTDP-4-amino-4,6-dideoxygalactose transaminase